MTEKTEQKYTAYIEFIDEGGVIKIVRETYKLKGERAPKKSHYNSGILILSDLMGADIESVYWKAAMGSESLGAITGVYHYLTREKRSSH